MKVFKCQCSLFKDFYADYLKNKVDRETKDWMEKHKEECSFCKGWAKSFEENREDIVEKSNIPMYIPDKTKKSMKKADVLVSLGIAVVVFVAFGATILLST